MHVRPLVLAAAVLALLIVPAAAGAATWGAPAEVAPSTMDDDPRGQVAELSNGDAVLVWQSVVAPSATRVVYASQRVDGAWSTPAPISAAGESAMTGWLRVGADGVGGAIAVWGSMADGASVWTVQAARFADGAWSTPTTISDAAVDNGGPVLAVAADGTASAAWPVSSDGWISSDLAVSIFDGDHWSATPAVVPGTENAGTPAIARSASGTTTLADPVWPVGAPSDPGTLNVQQLRDDGWHDLGAASAAGDGFAGAAPALAASGGDAFALVWTERPSNSPPERMRGRLFDGAAWDAATTLSTGSRAAADAGIAIAADGSGVATWKEDDAYVQARRFDAAGWSPTVDDLTQDPLDRVQQVQPRVAADGTAIVAWNAITPSTGARMQSARLSGGEWSALPEITPASPDAWFGSAAIAPDGSGAIVWAEIEHHDGASDTWSLMASQLAVPSNASGGGESESGGTHRTPPIRIRAAASGPRGIVLVLRATGPGRVRIAAVWRGGSRSTRSTVVCRGAKAIRRAGAVLVRCEWTRAGRALLATRSLRVRVTATFRPTGGGASTSVARWARAARLGPEPVTG